MPFAALQDQSGRYLVESHEISYLTTGRDLLRLQERAKESGRALIVANPEFGSPRGAPTIGTSRGPRAIDLSRARFNPLPGTAAEAKALSALMPEAEVRTGADATEAALSAQLTDRACCIWRLTGFSSAVPQSAPTSHRALSCTTPLGRVSPRATIHCFARASRSPARTRAGSGDDDGILTALEASSLDLWGTRMAVLSACETGVGETRRGDGVYGLRRALVVAGAESQVMSLWQVSDDGTRALMTDFYTKLKAGVARSAALREVQLQMLRAGTRKHPYYWSSFILSGADGPIAFQ